MFIHGRLITDNIMIAYEIVHCLKRRRQGKTGYAALKIDMSKAYNRLEWDYLSLVLDRMGFPSEWIQWMKMCVSTVRYSILHNGTNLDPIVPSRGLRQGCPLSPYLFILCAEGFSAMLRRYERRGLIHGCLVARGAPIVSHLFFADDSYLFFKATRRECQSIQRCIDAYETASGQKINFQKSSILFSPNTSAAVQTDLCNRLGVAFTLDQSKYLGLPSFVGKNKKRVLSFVKEKVWARMSSWKNKLLSKAGKEILIKSVAEALPTFAMSVFLLPNELCVELEGMMNFGGILRLIALGEFIG